MHLKIGTSIKLKVAHLKVGASIELKVQLAFLITSLLGVFVFIIDDFFLHRYHALFAFYLLQGFFSLITNVGIIYIAQQA